jgi:hypothetical protein
MLLKYKLLLLPALTLIDQSAIVTGLSVVVVFFTILLLLGVRKSYKLRKENEKLNKIGTLDSDEENKAYKDFTEGHMYDNK